MPPTNLNLHVCIHTYIRYIHTYVYLISRFKISNCTADVDRLLLNLNKKNRNLQYNCHKAKIIYTITIKRVCMYVCHKNEGTMHYSSLKTTAVQVHS